MRWLTAGGIAFLCAVFVSGCNDGDRTPVDDEMSLRFLGRVLVVNSEMIILHVDAANVGKKFIITPPPGFKNRFILESLPLKAGARLKITRWDHRTHWSGKTGVVPIVQLLGDERLAGVEMEFYFELSFDTARDELYVDPFYLRLLPESKL